MSLDAASSVAAPLGPRPAGVLAAAAPVWPLLATLGVLLLGNGLQNILLPTRAVQEGMATDTIGLVFTAYFAAFLLGCIVAPRLLRQAGHARCLAAATATAAAAGISYAFLVHPLAWAALRGVSGFAFAIVYVVADSWLNEKASNTNRGRVLSIYRLIDLAASTAGQFLIGVADPGGFQLFALFALLVGVSVVPVLLSTRPGPGPVGEVRLQPLRLWRLAPAGIVVCISVGFANSALWSLAPVYAAAAGLPPTGTAWLISAIIIGGALAQWPLGRWSDLSGRRGVLVGGALAAAAAGLLLMFAPAFGLVGIGAAALLFGAAAMPLYTLASALVNDRVGPTGFVEAASSLLLVYSIGATAGPMAAGALMDRLGPSALFGYTAAVHGAAGLFVLLRVVLRPRGPVSRGAA